MENYDSAMAERVWQRVRGEEQPEQDWRRLPALISAEYEAAAAYLSLSRRIQNKNQQAVLRRIAQEEQAHGACLKGIYHLITGDHAAIPTPTVSTERIDVTLRRCYGREMQCLAEYEARSADREYGAVFSRLAQQEQEHCRLLLELIGSLPQEAR